MQATAVQDEDCKFLLNDIFMVLTIEFFLYTLVAIYLAAVLPDENGVRDPPYFFLLPSFWFPEKYRATAISRSQQAGAPVPGRVDSDVHAEALKMQSRALQHSEIPAGDAAAAVEVYGLQRSFGGASNRFWAVADSWFEIPKHQLFCLLGPNGAGMRLFPAACLTAVTDSLRGRASRRDHTRCRQVDHHQHLDRRTASNGGRCHHGRRVHPQSWRALSNSKRHRRVPTV